MPTSLTLSAEDWAGARFVRSRLWEAMHAVRTITWPESRVLHRAWLETVDVRAARQRVPLLAALNPRKGVTPDFLVPPGRPDVASIDDELAEVSDSDLAVVVDQVTQSLAAPIAPARAEVVGPLLVDPARLVEQAVDELRWAWDELLSPWWGQVDRLLERDVAYRSRDMARHGVAHVVDELHPEVDRDGDVVTLERTPDRSRPIAGQGFALMPSAFAWPHVILVEEPPWPVTIVYPARGIAELWEAPPRPADALVEVLGRTRALLLADLGVAATTTALAARHGLTTAAVSAQLQRLLGAGLLSAERLGKEVRYRRTPVGDSLVRASR